MVTTPDSTDRLAARALVRTALCQTLGAFLGQPAASVHLVSRPGQAIAVDSPRCPFGLSLSHAPGLSLAAMGQGVCVGIDVVRMDDGVAADAGWLGVARDYLGPQVTAWLQATTPAECPVAFARAWTRLEAGLKCLGLGLTEWSPALGQQLATCQVRALDFAGHRRASPTTDGHFLGAIAMRTADRFAAAPSLRRPPV